MSSHSNEESILGFVAKERYKLCPACGNFVPLSERDTFCTVCGEKLIDECPNCREPILYPVARFCPACGTRVAKPPTAGPDVAVTESNRY
jgi:predicted amidophosphoribosyltransferase